jgi:hypothetical protein
LDDLASYLLTRTNLEEPSLEDLKDRLQAEGAYAIDLDPTREEEDYSRTLTSTKASRG